MIEIGSPKRMVGGKCAMELGASGRATRVSVGGGSVISSG